MQEEPKELPEEEEFIPTEEQLEAYQEILDQLRPIDDDFMRELFRDCIELAELVLQTVLDIPDLRVTTVNTQYDLKRPGGARGLCLDVMAEDSSGKKYDIEVQRDEGGAISMRARFHASSMDVEFLNAGDKFDKLPETYVIFFTETDIFNGKRLIYRFDRLETSTYMPFGDKQHIIYINCAYDGPERETALGKLAHDLKCTKADEMYTGILADRVRHFKEKKEGRVRMCSIYEKYADKRAEEAAKEAEAKAAAAIEAAKAKAAEAETKAAAAIEAAMAKAEEAEHMKAVSTAVKMIKKGLLTIEEIADYNGLPFGEVKSLADSLGYC